MWYGNGVHTDLAGLLRVRYDRCVSANDFRREEVGREDTGRARLHVLTLSLVVGTASGVVGEHDNILFVV